MEGTAETLKDALAELDCKAPGAPLLALGQTVFWDELMKAGIGTRADRKFVFGVHDTDYFAKLSQDKSEGRRFVSLPHNDTTTRGLWSAAGEFSAMFGSETVVTKEMFQRYGAHLEKLGRANPKFIDEATEAWGWRGLVALGEDAPLTAHVKTVDVLPSLLETLTWAIDLTLESVSEPDRLISRERARDMIEIVNRAAPTSETLADLYETLLPELAEFVTGEPSTFSTTRTTEILRFNKETSLQSRFDLVDLFVNPDTRQAAKDAYNSALKGGEIYSLDRFMSGAIPFDLVIPGIGRGTLRLANRAVIIMTPKPQFISLKKPLGSVQDLAAVIEGKFGRNCTLIGKAVALIGMLSREFVFVFHEGASSYVPMSRRFHQNLEAAGIGLHLNPILRVRYSAWDAIRNCCTWLRLPAPLQRPFGTEEICAPSIAARWREVQRAQEEVLDELRRRQRPIELIQYLRDQSGPSWKCLAEEYAELNKALAHMEVEIQSLRQERHAKYGLLRTARKRRVEAEKAKGAHFRSFIFGQTPTAEANVQREQLSHGVEVAVHEVIAIRQEIRELLRRQREIAGGAEVVKAHDRRRAIEREAELRRIRMIKSAFIATAGLTRAAQRPSSWWFSLVCPDGGWFKETIDTATYYLEPLV